MNLESWILKVRDIDYDHLEMLYEVLGRILVKPEVSDSHNKNNAGYSILFEAISLIISFGHDAPEYLRDQGSSLSTSIYSICSFASQLPYCVISVLRCVKLDIILFIFPTSSSFIRSISHFLHHYLVTLLLYPYK